MAFNKKRRKPKTEFEWGDWKLVKKLGTGGNGEVWLAANGKGDKLAIKFLHNFKGARLTRFIREVSILSELGEFEGVIPLKERRLDGGGANSYWYAMPVAEGDTKQLCGKLVESVKAVVEIANTLCGLHEKGIFHRDIKPANILKWRQQWCLTDFGLADSPDTEDLTGMQEELGAKWTIAPEMRRRAKDSAGGPADVYSLAKTLWILIAASSKGFDGTYNRESDELSLGKRCASQFVGPVEDLIEDATDYSPGRRPLMAEFRERLSQWLEIRNEFHSECRSEWKSLQRRLFPRYRPERAIWTERGAIIEILNVIGERRQINHTFLPTGGGLDLESARVHPRDDCVELFLGSKEMPSLVRPVFLELVLVDEHPEWSYFWLETAELEPTGLYKGPRDYEEYVELPNGELLERGYWDEKHYCVDGVRIPLPASARLVVRYLRGALLIVAKRSPYNLASETYDGRHAKMTSQEFYDYMRRSRENGPG